MEKEAQHAWPGDVRELRNVVQRCAIEAAGSTITGAEARMVLWILHSEVLD